MPHYLRAFLFDSSHPSDDLVSNVFSSWEKGVGVSIISANQPQVLVEKAIVKCDPNEVVHGSDVTTRNLAIVETPDLAAVVFTSGTTSDPKPVELSFRAMKNSVAATYEALGLDHQATWLCCMPPSFIAGLAIFARCFVNDARLVFHERFDVDRVAHSLKDDNINAVSLVSSQLTQLLDAGTDLSTLDAVLLGGSSVRPELIDRCVELGIALHTTYGMTETWGGICHDGKLFDNTQARINSDGVIEVSSSSLMSGYRHNYPGTIERITTDGYFVTSDRGTLIDGILSVQGRVDDVINSGGIKVDPESIETLLRAIYPDRSIWICATPHEKYGQCVTACFLSSESPITLQELRDTLAPHLPSTHLPLRIATVESAPTTESGKVQRSQLSSLCIVIEEHE